MRYPIFSNWIIYKKIPDYDAYVVKDCVLKNKYVISGEKMQFAQKLDGKTNPYSIKGKRSREEIRNLMVELDHLGVIRTDHGVISRGMGGYIRTLVRTRNTRSKRIASELLNFLLVLLFVPVLIGGIYIYILMRIMSDTVIYLASNKYCIDTPRYLFGFLIFWRLSVAEQFMNHVME